MALIQKFMFETDFDQNEAGAGKEGRPAKAAKKPPPPTYTEADMAAAKEQAHAAGHAAGVEEAEQASTRMLAQAMEAVAQALQKIGVRQAEANALAAQQSITVALACVRKILPQLERRHGLAEVEALLGECVAHLSDQARLVIRVHPQIAEAVRQSVEEIVARNGFDGRVTVADDEAMALSDCVIDWGEGGAVRDRRLLWSEVERVLERHLGDAARFPEENDAGDTAETADSPAGTAE